MGQVIDWIKHHATRKPEKIALHELPSGRELTYAQMHERVARLAGFFRSKGIKKGDRVAFLTLNSIDTMETLFACWRIGAICVALNFRLTPPELKFILDNSETDMVIVDSPFTPLADALKSQTKVKFWINTEGMGQDSEYETAISEASPVYENVDLDFDEQCMLMYSSGTTGTPKGVIITHGMMYFSCSSGMATGEASTSGASLCNMPLFHIGGLNTTAVPAMWAGATSVILRLFDPQATLEAINRSDLDITVLFMVPAAYNALKAHPKCEETDFSRINVAKAYIPHKVGSAGRALMHSTIRIVDEAGETCAPNVPGEIWFKGLCVTPGYWRRPDANKENFVDGWFRSGDIGRMDEDGFIYIEDRIKDMYISGGENVV